MIAEEILIETFIRFAMELLPKLIAGGEDPVQALEKIGKAWRENRTVRFEVPTETVKANRARVDAKLVARKAKKP